MSQICFISDRDRRARRAEEAVENSIRRQAALLRDQADLDQLLEGAEPAMRTAMIERLRPYLHFEAIDILQPTADCPNCGMKRGTVIAHACTTQ